MSQTEKQIEKARQAVNAVFNQTFVDETACRESLETLQEHVAVLLASLK